MRLASLTALVFVAGCAAAPVDPRMDPDGGGFIPLPDVPDAPSCRGNRDGVIDRAEVIFAPGVEVRYRINPPGTQARVDARGTVRADGTRAWDFRDTTGTTTTLSLLDARTQWFAARFPTAQYAARLDPRASNLGVYRATDTAIELLGVAGAAEAEGTLVRYGTPVELLRFPLRVGAMWSVESTTVESMVQNTPVASRDRYDVTVDARGEVRLTELTFADAVRVRVETTQRFPAGPGVRRVQYPLMVECYGEAARMTSLDNEVNPDFTMAVEFRRLGL